ncbi:MAG: heterodisulfide reductase-related iron-sulfur binding cluster [Dehalococcoidia bacterium]|nr:heterodisulfide reductase-related iron-sulfur binding cluster [Dehalococcoidia bacterium]
MPSREHLWNIHFGDLVYPIGFLVIAIIAFAIYRRVRLWTLGRSDDRLSNLPGRFWNVFVKTKADALWHQRIMRSPYAGVMHALIFGGFGLLLIGTSLDALNTHVYHFLEGNLYLGFSLATDTGGLLALAGIGMAAYRRYVLKPSKLNNVLDDAMALSLLALILVTGFMVEGLRIAETELEAHPGWAPWSPIGFVFAQAFSPLSESATVYIHQALWWGHMGISFGGMVYVFLSFTKLAHILTAPLNMFLRSQNGRGVLQPIDLEAEEIGTLGAAKLQDFTWKDLLDLDACTRCGRCQDVCPAARTGKALSPKNVIQELKAHMLEQGPALTHKGNGHKDEEAAKTLIGETISEDELWACTTCGACEEVCPVYIEPIRKMIEMRRNLVLEQGNIPATMMASLRSTQDRGHPWKGASASRTDWASGLSVENISNNGDSGLLFWVGCTEGVQETTMNIPIALAKVFERAGVQISFLGHEESCCGHFARRMGDEYLFQCQARQNIETLQRHNVKKIVTACPHCYHTLKYEYPQFGGEFEVVHHTEFILQLIEEGKLRFTNEMNKTVAYQDPCYLGRYHGIYEAPRKILAAIPGVKVVEMESCGANSLCCGAGGGRMWMEEEPEQRVNIMRSKEAVATKADMVITACPFCLQMFKDGLGGLGLEEPPEVLDLVELLERATSVPAPPAKVAPTEAGVADEALTEVGGN